MAGADPDIYEIIGRGYLLARQPADARAAFERARQARPEFVEAQLGLASVLEAEGKRPEAIASLQQIAQRYPKSAPAKERLGRLLLATGELPRADQVANELVKLQGSGSAYMLLGDVRRAQKQLPQAEQAFRKAVELSPGQSQPLVSLARAVQSQGRNDEAIRLLDEALKRGNNSFELYAALGSSYRRAGRYQQAVDAHQKLVQTAPSSPMGYLLLGADHFATGQWDAAHDDYTNALKVAPQDPRARHWLAVTLSQRARAKVGQGQLDGAVRDLRRAFDLERAAVYGRSLGAVLLTQKSADEAKGVMDQVMKLKDASWRDALLAGYANLAAGKAQEALQIFETAGKNVSQPEAAADIYAGWALAKLELGDFDTAVSKLMSPGTEAKTTVNLTQANLPLALSRRALEKLKIGDATTAAKDIETSEKLPGGRSAEAVRLNRLARALLFAEEGRAQEATSALRAATPQADKLIDANARTLLEAYLEYRKGRFPEARKLTLAAQKRATGVRGDWATQLLHGVDRRDAERAYTQGAIPRAEKAIKIASAEDPLNPFVVHTLSCVKYRKGDVASAVKGWESVLGAVPEAALNLGIAAQEKQHDYARAVDYYRRYVATGGPRANVAREWKERLQSLHGIEEPQAAPGSTPSAGSNTPNPVAVEKSAP